MANSELAKSLDQPVSLEELLAHQEDKERCIRLLAILPQLENNKLKLSNCLLDKTLPYDSLVGLSNTDLVFLQELCKYLILSDDLIEKVSLAANNGSDIAN